MIVARELDPSLHPQLRALTDRLSERDARTFISMADSLREKGDRDNVDAIMRLAKSRASVIALL